jgi:SAM-dependent methyltransferase
MSDWSEGYMTEVDYTHGYYGHLNPSHMRLAMLNAGLTPPKVEAACELGFGQGVTVNIHAAASSVVWHGNDFNPSHAAFANRLAADSGAAARLSDESFADYCRQPHLPDFDFIVLHGIWSWISDDNRTVIVDFVRRKLKPGGVLCISYNTLHGWAAKLPIRDLLREHASRMSAPGLGMVPRIDAALAFADQVLAVSPAYTKSYPKLIKWLADTKGEGRHYLAGEYFSDHWHPMSFADVARWLDAAKLSYGCSSKWVDHVNALRLTRPQQAMLDSIADPVYRETVRDVFLNQAFRAEYWVKGVQPLGAQERAVALLAQHVVLTSPTGKVLVKAKMASGDTFMGADDFAPLIQSLSSHQSISLAELAQAVKAQGTDFTRFSQAIFYLASEGHLNVSQDDDAIFSARAAVLKLNLALLQKTRAGVVIEHLASPVTGGGIHVRRYHQLFLLARAEGHEAPEDWAQAAMRDLAAQGERVVPSDSLNVDPVEDLAELIRLARAQGRKDPEAWARGTQDFLMEFDRGPDNQAHALLTPEGEVKELQAQAADFADQRLPVLLKLGVM